MKKFIKWIYANKISLSATISNAVAASVGITASWTIDSLPSLIVDGVNIAPIIYTVICLITFVATELGITGRGFESVITFLANKQIITEERAKVLLEKSQLSLIKKAEKLQKKAEEEAVQQSLITRELEIIRKKQS